MRSVIFVLLGAFSNIAVVFAQSETVTKQYIEVLTSASRGATVAFLIERGERFALLKRKTDWLKVQATTGETGWINLDDLYANHTKSLLTEHKLRQAKPKWNLGASTGYFGEDKRYNLSAAYYLFRAFSLELNYSKVAGEYSNSNMLSGDLLLHFFTKHKVQPYIAVAYGHFENQARKSLINGKTTRENVNAYAVGIDVNPYKRLGLRFSLGSYQLVQSNKSYVDWRIGILAFIN